jgi:hypothetical protein
VSKKEVIANEVKQSQSPMMNRLSTNKIASAACPVLRDSSPRWHSDLLGRRFKKIFLYPVRLLTLYFKVLFMEKRPEETLSDIHRLMERSSRFHSLSGFSLVAAGVCGLLGSWWLNMLVYHTAGLQQGNMQPVSESLRDKLAVAAVCTFIAAALSAFFFTWLKARKKQLPLWDVVFRKVTLSFVIPMFVGAVLITGMMYENDYTFIAACCLLFYGLSLVNAAHHTLKEIRYLGMFEILLGILCLFSRYELLSLAMGFGVLNILYGLRIWYKYHEVA